MEKQPTLSQLVEELCAEQRRRWQAGDCVPAQEYFDRHPALAGAPDSAAELVYNEVVLREERGEVVAPQEYLRRFPHLEPYLQRVFEVHKVFGGESAFPGDTPRPAGPAPPPAAGAAPAGLPCVPGYEVLRELGRGGMGVVYLARHVALNRLVTLKMLRGGAHADAEELTRFRTEAEAQARLQHANIVQIHEVGEAHGEPYVALEYVEGGSLTQALGGTPRPPREAAQLAEVLARAVHYAHQRGVLHRDLKPANVLLASPAAPAAGAPPSGAGAAALAARTPKVTDFGLARRLEGEAGQTESRAVLGTPSYMPPEQAAGKRDLGPAADIYALGAILYECLTGRPPFVGASALDTLLQVKTQEPVPVRRLQPRVPRDLETICHKCLQKEPGRRYRTADALAEDLRRFQAGEPIQARPVGRAERLALWCRRNPARAALSVGLLMAVAALVLVGGGSWWWLERKKSEAVRGVEGALQEARRLQAEEKWPEALAVARQAEGLLTDGVPADLQRRVRDLRADLEVVAELEESHLLGFDDEEAADRAFAAAFRKYGIDVLALEPGEAAERIGQRNLRAQLTAALARWAFLPNGRLPRTDSGHRPAPAPDDGVPLSAGRDYWKMDPQVRERLLAVIEQVEGAGWLLQLRAAQAKGGPALRGLADSMEVGSHPPMTLAILGIVIHRWGETAGAIDLLQRAQRQYSSDFLVNHALAIAYVESDPPQSEEAIRFFTATVALRPCSPIARTNLGVALAQKGRLDEAIAAHTDALRLCPDFALAYNNLGVALVRKGRCDEAVAAYRAAIRLRPDDAKAHTNLGNALAKQGLLDEAIAAHRAALRFQPDYAMAYSNLGVALGRKGRMDEAVAAFQKALRLRPDFALARGNLGNALAKQGHWDDAIAVLKEALHLQPELAVLHYNLGVALEGKGNLDGALAAYREAIRLQPDYVDAHNNLGVALNRKGRPDEAGAAFREAIRLQPTCASAHNNLGIVLDWKGKLDEAIAAFREAIRLQPDYAAAHYNYGLALARKGKLDEAIAAFREAIRLQPDYIKAYNSLGIALDRKGLPDDAVATFREALRIRPDSALTHRSLALVLEGRGRLDEAIAVYEEALRVLPKDAPLRCGLGHALMRKRDLDGAIAAYHEAIRLEPDNAEGHYSLGRAFLEKSWPDRAVVACNEAVRLKPDYAVAHSILGHALRQQGQFAEALAAYRRAHELGSKEPRWPFPSAQWVCECERLVELDGRLSAVLKGQDRPSADEQVEFAQLCARYKQLPGAAARLYQEAFAARPELAEDRKQSHRYHAACAAARAGCGQGRDDPPPDESTRSRWRQQALDWLRADLAQWGRHLEGDAPQAAAALRRWRAAPELAGLREETGLATLPEAEQETWRRLWADVDALLTRSQGKR